MTMKLVRSVARAFRALLYPQSMRFVLAGVLACVVLSSGGQDIAETTASAAVRTLLEARPAHGVGESATRLADGSWLLIGGERHPDRFAVMDTNGHQQQLNVSLNQSRTAHTATLLPDGSVLIIGGGTSTHADALLNVEIFEPRTQSVASLGNTGLRPRANHTATLMLDGRVLIAGGIDPTGIPILQAELFDPVTLEVEHISAQLDSARLNHIAAHLLSDEVLLWAGTDEIGRQRQDAVTYDSLNQYFSTISKQDLDRSLDELTGAESMPRVIKSVPAAGGQHASIHRPVVVQFNRLMDVSTLSAHSVTLLGPNGPAAIRSMPTENGRLLFVTPENDLIPGARYTLFITGARDTKGRSLEFTPIAFTTPRIESTNHTAAGVNAHASNNRGSSQSSVDRGSAVQTRPPSHPIAAPDAGAAGLHQRENIRSVAVEPDRWHPNARNLSGDWRSDRRKRAGVARPKNERLSRALHGHPEIKSRMGTFTPGTVSRDSLKGLVPQTFQVPEKGLTAIVGQVARLDGQALEGIRISMGARAGLTDSDGEFRLENIPGGHQVLVIDGSSGRHTRRPYGRYEYGIDVTPNQLHVLPFTIWLTALDTENAMRIASPTTATTVLSNPDIPGLELRIPAGTVIRDAQGKVVTEISMTAIPTNQAPFPLPSFPVPTYFTVQPGGAHFESSGGGQHQGAQLIYPNFSGSPPGTRMLFWNYDPSRGWHEYGKGTVTADGSRVIPDPGVVIHGFSGAMVSGPEHAPEEKEECDVADPVDCATGIFIYESTDLTISDVIPLEARRSYRNRDPLSRSFGVGTGLSYDIFNVGPSYSNPDPNNGTYTYQKVILPGGQQIYYARISPGVDFTDAVYQNTNAPGKFYGSIIQWEPIWWRWMLTLRDGTKYFFEESEGASLYRQAAASLIEDRNGNQLKITRDGNTHALTKIISPSGRYLEFEYDAQARIIAAHDDAGRTIQYAYDSLGRLEEVTDQNSNTESYTYDSASNMLTVTDKRGNTKVTNTYDGDNRVTTQTYADASSVSFDYTVDTNGHVTQTDFTDQLGVVNRMSFNTEGYLTEITYALGLAEEQSLSIDRNSSTKLIESVTDPLGRTTAYNYDALGNVTERTQLAGMPGAATTEIEYSTAFSRPTSITDRGGRVTTLSYNGVGDLEGIEDPLGHTRGYTHDARGRVLTETNENDVEVASYLYLGSGSMSVTNALGQTRAVEMSDASTVLRTDALGAQSTLNYDNAGRVASVMNATNSEISFQYDENGNMLQHVDANQNVTTFTYDVMNRVATQTDAYSNVESFAYDAVGRLTRRTDRKGQVSGITWDGLGRPTQVGFGATVANPTAYARTAEYTWDDGNRLIQIVDSVSGTITRSYDDLNRLLSETTPQGTVGYTYDTAGRRATMTVQGQPALAYSWDDADRLLQIEQAAGASNGFVAQSVGFTYDDAGRRTRTTLPNGVRTDYSYNDADQVIGVDVTTSTAQALGNLTYSYDAAGRRIGIGGSLANVDLPAAMTAADYGVLNELLEWDGQAYTYDDNGNVTGDGTNTYSWNALDQLTSVTGGMSASFEYDGFGRRIGRTVNGSAIGYLFDGVNFVQEKGGTGPQATVTANLLVGGVDELFARVWNGSVTSVLTDIQGSVMAETDDSETVISSFSYEAYGGTSVTGNATITQNFAGRERDAANLYFNRTRYYNATTGRFLSEDLVGWGSSQPNNYAYVHGNPVTYTDPFGLWKHHIFPQANYQNYSPAAQHYFNQATIETAGAHKWTKAHAEYNKATDELAEAFCKRRGIDRSTMSGYDAEQLIDEILNSNDPKIKDFLEQEMGPPRPQTQEESMPKWSLNPVLLFIYLMSHSAPAY